jgi:alkylhydroperoxidase/carboxymuconolactone decarboxylase family protein YurZ
LTQHIAIADAERQARRLFGVTPETLVEVITQMAMYGGLPAALNATQVLDECVAEGEA